MTLVNPHLSNFLVSNINFQLFQSMAYHLFLRVKTMIWRRKRKPTVFKSIFKSEVLENILDCPVKRLISSCKLCTDACLKQTRT